MSQFLLRRWHSPVEAGVARGLGLDVANVDMIVSLFAPSECCGLAQKNHSNGYHSDLRLPCQEGMKMLIMKLKRQKSCDGVGFRQDTDEREATRNGSWKG